MNNAHDITFVQVDVVDFQELVYDASMMDDRVSDLELDQMHEDSGCNVGCESGSTSDSSDTEFHESDYNKVDDDDDDQIFEINVHMGIERDMGDVNFRKDSPLSHGIAFEDSLDVQPDKELDYENFDSLHSVDKSDDLGICLRRRWVEFNKKKRTWKTLELKKQMVLSEKEALRETIRQYMKGEIGIM